MYFQYEEVLNPFCKTDRCSTEPATQGHECEQDAECELFVQNPDYADTEK